MTTKDYLKQYNDARKKINAIKAHIDDLRSVCEQLRTEDGESIHLDAAVAELVDSEKKACAEVMALCKTEGQVISTIEKVKEPYSTLLYERYVNCKTWEQIAVDMGYSYRQTTRLHGAALIAVKDVLECPI